MKVYAVMIDSHEILTDCFLDKEEAEECAKSFGENTPGTTRIIELNCKDLPEMSTLTCGYE